jgi:hypothetical protein
MSKMGSEGVPNPRKMRQLYAALEDQFDITNKRYKGAASDETVAKMLELSPIYVANVRREAFGELGPDPRIHKLETDIDQWASVMMTSVEKLEKELAALRTRLNQIKG